MLNHMQLGIVVEPCLHRSRHHAWQNRVRANALVGELIATERDSASTPAFDTW
jgi:hypothetical protein